MVIITCLFLCAFFSGMEIAFISSNKIYLEIEKKQDNFISNILTKITEKPSKFIATMLVGNNISMVVYGFFMGELLSEQIKNLGFHFSEISTLLLQTIISTLTVLITAEFLPKVFFQIYANSLMKILALPSYFFYKLFYFISSFIIWISDVILKKFFKTEGDYVPSFFSKVELGNYINEQLSTVEEHQEVDSEIQIFQNALDFSGVKAREIMTPRTELVALEVNDNIADLHQKFVQTGYSKILIYQSNIDNIIGYVHSFELFKKPSTIQSIMIDVEFIPETIFVKDALNQLTKKRKSLAVVIDEYGGTSGIVTLEDIIEELFGEIEDEHDDDETLTDTKLNDSTYLLSARLEVTYLNETYNLNIPEEDSYETLGGFIVNTSKEILTKGNEITIDNFHIVIEEASNNKIGLVKVTILD